MAELPHTPPLDGVRASLDRLVAALESAGSRLTRRGDHVQAQCPAHEDRNPSLGIDWRPDPGRVLVQCYAGCGLDDVLTAAGLARADLYDAPTQPRNGTGQNPRYSSGQQAARKPTQPAGCEDCRRAEETAVRSRHPAVTHTYTDENGTPLGRVARYRYECRNHGAGKTLRWAHWDGTRWRPGLRGQVMPLYRAPEIARAVASGESVYVTEGETDADALATAGHAATCNPGGADRGTGGKWRTEHTQALTGAHVVLVADRDEQGYRHVAYVASQLAGVAASVAVTEPATGHDTRDHLKAGYTPADLTPVPVPEATLAAHAPAAAPAEPDQVGSDGASSTVVHADFGSPDSEGSRSSGGGGGGTVSGLPVVRDRFAVVEGSLCKLERPKGGVTEHAREVLGADVRIMRRVRRDLGDGDRVTVSHVDLQAHRGEETIELPGVPMDEYEALSWVTELGSDVRYKRTQQGKSDALNAIGAVSGDVPTVTAYGAMGWRELDDGRWIYIHGGGALGVCGPVADVRVDVDRELADYTLPDPPGDPAAVRDALGASLALLDQLPPRIAAPLLGVSYRSLLGPCNTTVYLTGLGQYGTYKSSLAALALSHHMPTARYDKLSAPASEQGTTLSALELPRFVAGHMLFVADDLAPDGGTARQRERGNMLARSQYNQVGKRRMDRKGGLRPTHNPRGLLMLTGEDGGSGSGESRMLYVPVTRGEVALDTLTGLHDRQLARNRAGWTGVMVRELAGRLPVGELVERYQGQALAALRDPAADDPGVDARTCGMVADLAAGWRVALHCAVRLGALTAGEAREVWARAWAGLVECRRDHAEVTAGRATHERAGELLRSALGAGHAHIATRAGICPDDLDLARALGWHATGTETRANGDGVGWVSDDGTRIYLNPGAATAVVTRQARAEGDPLEVTPRALAGALAAADLMRTRDHARQREQSVRVRIAGQQRLVWELPFTWLYPDGSGNDTPATPEPPPGPPPLFDDDEPPAVSDEPPRPHEPSPPAEGSGGEQRNVATGSHADPDSTSVAGSSRSAASPVDGPGRAPAPSGNHDAAEPDPQAAEGPHGRTGAAERRADSTAGPGQEETASEKHSEPVCGVEEHTGRFAALAAVVDVDGAWLTPRTDTEAPRFVEVPEFGSLLDVVRWAAGQRLGMAYERRGQRDEPGQVWIMSTLARRLGITGKVPSREKVNDHGALASLRDDGWEISRKGLHHWTMAYRPDGSCALRVALVGWQDPSDLPLVAGDPSALELAARISAYVHAVGFPVRWSAAITGTDLMRHTRRPTGMRVEEAQPPPPAVGKGRGGSAREMDWLWSRILTGDEAEMGYLHAYDRSGQYLAAASSVRLGLGQPQHRETPEFDPSLPGYWRVDPADWHTWLTPDLFDPASRGRLGPVWLATPTLAYAQKTLDYDITPTEAYVYLEHGQYLEPWYKTLRDARKALLGHDGDPDMKAVLDTVKRTYAAGIGWISSRLAVGSLGPLYRPDWRHAIVSTARVNLLRKIMQTGEQTGRWPVAVAQDCLYYPSNDPDPVAACPAPLSLGRGLGQVTPEMTLPITEELRTALAGPRAFGDYIKQLKQQNRE